MLERAERIADQFQNYTQKDSNLNENNIFIMTLAKVKLMQIGLEIKNKKIVDTYTKLQECENLFALANSQEGEAETLLMKAVWYI